MTHLENPDKLHGWKSFIETKINAIFAVLTTKVYVHVLIPDSYQLSCLL